MGPRSSKKPPPQTPGRRGTRSQGRIDIDLSDYTALQTPKATIQAPHNPSIPVGPNVPIPSIEEGDEDGEDDEDEEDDVPGSNVGQGNPNQTSVQDPGGSTPIVQNPQGGPSNSSGQSLTHGQASSSQHGNSGDEGGPSTQPSGSPQQSSSGLPPPVPPPPVPQQGPPRPNSPLFTSTPTPVPTPPDDDPDDESSSDDGTVESESQRRRSFLSIFWDQLREGRDYLMTRKAMRALVLAMCLLVLEICSAEPLCEQNWWFVLLFRAFIQFPVSYVCLLAASTLAMLGVYDTLEGLELVASAIGVRNAHKERNFGDKWYSISNLAFVKDICDLVTEPLLILVLSFALRFWLDFFDESRLGEDFTLWCFSLPALWSDPVKFVWVSGILHVIKWVCQTVEIYFSSIQRSSLLRKPLVFGLLLLLTMLATFRQGGAFAFFTEDDLKAARQYHNTKTSHQDSRGHNIVNSLVGGTVLSVAGGIGKVTHDVVMEWVQPTRRM